MQVSNAKGGVFILIKNMKTSSFKKGKDQLVK